MRKFLMDKYAQSVKISKMTDVQIVAMYYRVINDKRLKEKK